MCYSETMGACQITKFRDTALQHTITYFCPKFDLWYQRLDTSRLPKELIPPNTAICISKLTA